MEAWVKAQVENGRYANDREYFRDLIRRDQETRRSEHDLRALIRDGLDRGVRSTSVEEIARDVDARLGRHGKVPADE